MLERIYAQLQEKMYQSVLDKLHVLIGQSSGQYRSAGAHSSTFDDLIGMAARRYDLDASLIKAVIHAESGFSPSAVSRVGAKGLMQLMDDTASQLGVTDVFDPAQNIDGGARFLSQLLDRYDGDVIRALAAYNAGPTAVDRWQGVPPYGETQAYVQRVLGLRTKYREWMA